MVLCIRLPISGSMYRDLVSGCWFPVPFSKFLVFSSGYVVPGIRFGLLFQESDSGNLFRISGSGFLDTGVLLHVSCSGLKRFFLSHVFYRTMSTLWFRVFGFKDTDRYLIPCIPFKLSGSRYPVASLRLCSGYQVLDIHYRVTSSGYPVPSVSGFLLIFGDQILGCSVKVTN